MEARAWRVSIRPSAGHEIDELDESVRQEALAIIMDLRDDPFPADTVLLRGYRNLYRIRFYREQVRIVYTVSSRSRRIIIERVRRRGNAYVGLRDLRQFCMKSSEGRQGLNSRTISTQAFTFSTGVSGNIP
jgi:mRNA-degrading endonuclease RelE of RelBE toxin-antitoxin system